jgi:Putative Flp pilus-assembly TadE/G-like
MRCGGRRVRNERGSTIALIAVCLFGMLALAALGIDLSALRDARSEAQRAADAIALAGASAFRDIPIPANAVQPAQDRALLIARVNKVRSDTIDIRPAVPDFAAQTVSVPGGNVKDAIYNGTIPVRTVTTNEVTLNIISAPDSQKVRVWVRRAGTRTFFAGLLARPYGHVTAMATAWAARSGPTTNCLKPFVIPDIWMETSPAQDVNGNHYMEPNLVGPGGGQTGEIWKYEPASVGGNDYYIPFDPTATPPAGQVQTGYGSPIRSGVNNNAYPNDVGLPLLIKPQTGNGNGQPQPDRMGNAFWLLDLSPTMDTREEISNGCFTANVGDAVPYDQGSRTGPTEQGVKALVDKDPYATWNQNTKSVDNSQFSDWTESPRVITIGLIDPKYWTTNSKNTKPDPGSTFTNFARMFIQSIDKKENVTAIFIGPAPGGHGGPIAGPLVRTLQLIQ